VFYYSLFILFDLFYIILHFTLYFSEFYFHLEEADVPGRQKSAAPPAFCRQCGRYM